jgi:septal ring factor EnvC (AmiA/AmiB activator)
MNKKMSIVVCSAAFVAMGMGMPQCPGEKAMQQQVDAMQTSQQTMTTKLTLMDTQLKTVNSDATQTKQILSQLAQAIQAQKDALDREDVAIKDIQAKMTASATAKSKPVTKGKKHK